MLPTADSEETQVTSHNKVKSLSRDEPKSPETSEEPKPHNNRESLNMLLKELVFCIALALTTYGALHNSPTKVSKHPQAVRFFGQDSLVSDWYKGQLGRAFAIINRADVSLVMYYAPWDAECQYVRQEFEKAASVLGDRVHFAAINCWNPGSECRTQHNKIPSWPIIMAYTLSTRGIVYKGPRDAQSMITFLELMMKPLRRVANTEDLVHLLSICDSVAVGYTPLSEGSQHYNTWYSVALKVRELDTLGEICFAAVTSDDLAVDLGVDTVPNARLMLWNETKEYIGDSQSWNESALIDWLFESFSQPVDRIIPMWKKAFSFERHADGNPILMLFTPLNPLYEQIPNFALLREVAMEYFNCKGNESNQWIAELVKLQQVQRLLYQQRDAKKFCQEYKFKKVPKKPSLVKKEVISQYNKYPWNNATHKNHKSKLNSLYNFLFKRGLAITKAFESSEGKVDVLSNLRTLEECSTNIFPAEKNYYENQQCQSFEEQLHMEEELLSEDLGTSMLPLEDDPLTAENLIQDNIRHYCNVVNFAYELGPPVIPAREMEANVTQVHGLACARNFSLNMVAVDSVRNHHFAESLGIDVSNKKDMTTVVILDTKHESQYVLSEEYSARSLRQFISDFTHNRLKRSLRTHVEDAEHTHYFGSSVAPAADGVSVIELTTRTFRKVVNTPGKVTLVAVCGGACSASTARALISAARLLNSCGVPVQAARLDALRHDLPWHYTPECYPTVLVFPPDRRLESESRAAPRGARVSAGALVALALRALGTPQHLRVRLALCQRAATPTEKRSCLRDVREHISTAIDRSLRYWRQTDSAPLRNALYRRLLRLHRVSLNLQLLHITDLKDGGHKLNALEQSLNLLAKNWDIDPSLLKRNTEDVKVKS